MAFHVLFRSIVLDLPVPDPAGYAWNAAGSYTKILRIIVVLHLPHRSADLDHFVSDHVWYSWIASGSYTKNLRILIGFSMGGIFYIFFPCFGEDG
jgi:hypothetical protein